MMEDDHAQLAATDIPIPPLKTQRRIAGRLREQFEHLQQLKSALTDQLAALDQLRVPPSNRLETLSGNLKGFWSIRINQQWRILFPLA